jgi:hypothetical protein
MARRVAARGALSSTLAGVVIWLAAGLAVAHEIRPAIMDATVGAATITMELVAPIEPFVAGIDLSAVLDTAESERADEHDALRALPPAEMEARLRAAWPRIAEGFKVVSDGQDVPLTLETVEVPEVGDVGVARDSRLVIRGDLPPGTAPVTVGWEARFGSLVLRQGDAETGYSGYLQGGEISLPLPRDAVAQQSLGAAFVNYVGLGFTHIVPKGLDHILFVLGLFFFSLKARPLLMQVTAFTVAHTVTLALATLGIVSLPGFIVEPLIALSIAYVAVENILFGGPEARVGVRRVAVVFGFGLLHGIGFASVLGEIGLSPAAFLSGLIGFNIGVEFGQLAVLTLAFLLVGVPFGRQDWYRARVSVPISAAIGIMGLWWAIERVLA